MATRRDEGQRPRWQGDEVEDRPDSEAERAADRAEGNRAVRTDAEIRRRRHQDDDAKTPVPTGEPERDDGRATAPAADAAGDDIADAAEEHRARRDAGERPPRGKL